MLVPVQYERLLAHPHFDRFDLSAFRFKFATSAPFAGAIRDRRLAAEVAIIQRLAESLNGRLRTRDPLSERVHHSTAEAAWLAGRAVLRQMFARRPK